MKVLMLVPDCQMIDRRVLQQARSLAGAGYEVTLLAGFECARDEAYDWNGVRVERFRYDWDDERLKRLRARLPDRDGLKMFVNRLFMRYVQKLLLVRSFDMFALAQARRHRADVVHVHDLPLLKVGAMAAREWNVPLVFDAHEIYYEQDVLSPRARRRLRNEERALVPQLALFSTVNDAIAGHYERLYGVRPLVLMNAAERPPPGFDAASRADLRNLAGLPPAGRVVLYQGWISRERNIDTLVLAAGRLPADAYLVLIGYGEHEGQLRQLVERQPWRTKVRFLGRVEPDRILTLSAGADVGVIPYLPIDLNHEYCSPNKFFEYVQAGVPVVAHDLVFFRDMGRRYGVVRVGDFTTPQGAAECVCGLLADAAALRAMGEACRRAADELNWETEARKLLEAYSRIIPAG